MEIYVADISEFEKKEEICLACLSDDEYEYSKGIYNLNVRKKFVISRGLTRSILSHKLKIPAKQIEFKKTENGKPYVKNHSVYFSVSHSHKKYMIAIDKKEVGVDIEYMKDRDFIALAEQNFGKLTVDKLRLSSNIKEDFYRQWTLYEAAVKLHGGTIFSAKIKYPKYSYSECDGSYMLSIASSDEIISKLEVIHL